MTGKQVNLLVRASVLGALARTYANKRGLPADEILWNIHKETGQRYPITDITTALENLVSDDNVLMVTFGNMKYYRLQLGPKGHAIPDPLANDVLKFCAVS